MDEKTKEHIKKKLALLPRKPGCYLMKDNTGTIIYVGKAKILKNRVSSYFIGEKTGKTKALVSHIVDFEYIVTQNEKEAFLLEINLIKKYDPKYNIIFRDDKTYPYIMLTTHPYPKLEVVRLRNKKRKNAKLFGPYPSSFAARGIVNMLNRIYPLQKCNHFEDKLCLYYHIGECLGYCKLKVEKEKIDEMVKEITSFLYGNYDDITKKLKQDMIDASNKLNFEKAKEIKELLDYISKVLEKQKIDLTDNVNRDIFNYYIKDDFISIQVLHLRNGNLVERNSYIYELNEDKEDVLNNFIASFYQNNNDRPKEVLIPDELDDNLLQSITDIKYVKPTRGAKKKLVDMAYENAKIGLKEKFDLIKNDLDKTVRANEELGKLLNINIHRIESFDNSHLFGTYTVSGMVVFTDGKPNKKEYRKYKIIGNVKDDYHLMTQTIERRYSRVINDGLIKPDLILADGGIIQINAIKEVLDNLCLDIKVCGMKKNDKHRICALIDEDGSEISIEKNSNLFHYLEKISEEVHRFAISYHKDIRSKGSLSSILDNIPGIGEKRRKELIKEFKTINNIKNASIEELSKFVPIVVAQNIKDYLKDDE